MNKSHLMVLEECRIEQTFIALNKISKDNCMVSSIQIYCNKPRDYTTANWHILLTFRIYELDSN